MRVEAFFSLVMLFCCGCAGGTDRVIHIGNSEQRAKVFYGKPKIIQEQSGDLARWYVEEFPSDCEYKWPRSAVKKYYYPDKNLVVAFQYGKVISNDTIDSLDSDERRELDYFLRDFGKDREPERSNRESLPCD